MPKQSETGASHETHTITKNNCWFLLQHKLASSARNLACKSVHVVKEKDIYRMAAFNQPARQSQHGALRAAATQMRNDKSNSQGLFCLIISRIVIISKPISNDSERDRFNIATTLSSDWFIETLSRTALASR